MEQPSSKLTLHIWPGKWNLPSIEPSCLAAFLFLQFTAPGQFAVVECTNPDLSPTGLLPFLTYEHHVVASLASIIKFISSLKLKPSSISQETGNAETHHSLGTAEMVAWCAHVESNMGDLVAHTFYSLGENWWKLTKPALASMFPIPQRYYVPDRLRDSYQPRLEAAGLWHTPTATQDEKKKLTEFVKQVRNEKDEYSRVFGRAKVTEKARSFFDIYTRLLEKGSLNHERPTKLDILLAAHLLLLLDPPFPDPVVTSLLTESYPSLVDFARRIQAKASETPLQILPAQNFTWKSLIPWSQAGPTAKPRKKNADDIRFDRMRWGWMTLAAGSVFTYIWASGIRLVISFPAEGDDEPPREPVIEPVEQAVPNDETGLNGGADSEPELEGPGDILDQEGVEVYEEMEEQVDAEN